MCDFEEFYFVCRHSVIRIKSQCHWKRNHRNYNCNQVKVLRNTWIQEGTLCDDCVRAGGYIHEGIVYYRQPQPLQNSS